LTIRPAILGSGSGFRDGCFALPAGQLRQGGGTTLYAQPESVGLSVFPTSFFNNDGYGSVLFISNKSSHLSSVREIVFTRKTGIASRRRRGQGGNVLCLFALRAVLGVFFIICALLPSAPFSRLPTASQGGAGRGWHGMVARFLGASLNWAGPRSGSWGSIV
jgi:hypothetical protein